MSTVINRALFIDARKRADARAKLAAALHLLYGDSEDGMEQALRLTVEAGNIVRGALRDRINSEILDGRR